MSGEGWSSVTIHRAQPDDIPEAKQLLSETWIDTYGSYLSERAIQRVTSVWHDPKRLAAEAQHPQIYFAIAKEASGQIIGLTTVRQLDDEVIFMSRLYVHPTYQRKGIGAQLLHAAIEAFPGAKRLRLEVEAQNRKGRAFYRKHAFHEIGTRSISIEDDVLDGLVMERALP